MRCCGIETSKQSCLGSHFSHPTIKPSNVIIDAVSMSLMKGSVIDFATELIGSSFRVAENPQVSILPVPT